jgi:hypothetical protein
MVGRPERGRGGTILLLLLLLTGCSRSPAPHDGPIVLVTLDSLRTDVVEGLGGPPGLMPHLAALAREADWAGPAIASSSWGVPAMASIFTGLQPWQHQALHAGQARLASELITLPEALSARGYATAGYFTGHWYSDRLGYAQGFDVFQSLGRGRRALDRLSNLGGGRQFVWVHIPEPQAPYVRRDELVSRLAPPLPPTLPRRILPAQLDPFFDPAEPLPPGRRRQFWAMYRLNAAWADERLGRVLDALRASGQWDRTLLVVTANHGEELGEHRQILHGGNLGRQLLEVPLVIKLPRGFSRRLHIPAGQRAGTVRLWATLVEAAGGTVPPAVAPSLFKPGPAGVLSELYLTNGTNQFSWVEGNDQLLWESRFAPPEPEYYRALQVARPGLRLSEPPEAIIARLAAAFRVTPPLSGIGPPRLTLERWNARGSRPVDDPARQAALARRLTQAWSRFTPGELSPGDEVVAWRDDILANRPDGGAPRVHSSAVRASGS